MPQLLRILVILAQLYLLALFAWALLQGVAADRWGWLFLLSSVAHLLFLPLPLFYLLAWLRPHRPFLVSLGLATLLALVLYAPYWVSGPRPPVPAGQPSLTVMSYNMLGYNEDAQAVIAAIQQADADVVGLHELNPASARLIEQRLKDSYPYRWLIPVEGVSGIGLLSRYPFERLNEPWPERWVAPPQAVRLDFQGSLVTLLNFHAIPPLVDVEGSVQERERQAQHIVAFAAAHPGPFIALGDLNAGHLSRAYGLLTDTLEDAWQQAGWGPGHTFPGAASRGSSRPQLAGLYVPQWLVRIDYVFHSPDWQAHRAWIGPWDGVSDHRPVLATLSLR